MLGPSGHMQPRPYRLEDGDNEREQGESIHPSRTSQPSISLLRSPTRSNAPSFPLPLLFTQERRGRADLQPNPHHVNNPPVSIPTQESRRIRNRRGRRRRSSGLLRPPAEAQTLPCLSPLSSSPPRCVTSQLLLLLWIKASPFLVSPPPPPIILIPSGGSNHHHWHRYNINWITSIYIPFYVRTCIETSIALWESSFCDLHAEMGRAPQGNHLKQLREIFARFDMDSDGSLTHLELAALLRSLGLKPTGDQVSALLTDMDANGNGAVEFEELEAAIEPVVTESTLADQELLLEVFRAFDRDGNGYITAPELARAMAKMGNPLTFVELTEMIREADADGDGVISFPEFAAVMAKSAMEFLGLTQSKS